MIEADAVKNTSFGWAITIKNVISPLTVDEVPKNLLELFKVTVDGKVLDNKKLSLFYDGKEATHDNTNVIIGITVPVGAVIEFRCKGEKLSKGMHSFKLEIAARNDLSIDFEREVK